jgi:hypothetical protein
MTNSPKIVGVLVAVFLAVVSAKAQPKASSLELSIHVEANQSQNEILLTATVSNHSDKSACLLEEAFASPNHQIKIWDRAGKPQVSLPALQPYGKYFHGFDYSGAIYILPPHQEIDIYVDLSSFSLKPDRYQYQWLIPYYRCDSILSLETSPNREFMDPLAFQTSGSLVVSPKR